MDIEDIADYIEGIEHLPAQIREQLTAIRELDLAVQNAIDEKNERAEALFQNAWHMKPEKRDSVYKSLLVEFSDITKDADEKINIADQMHTLLVKCLERLDEDIARFKVRLDKVDPKISTAIEQKVEAEASDSSGAIKKTTVTSEKKVRPKIAKKKAVASPAPPTEEQNALVSPATPVDENKENAPPPKPTKQKKTKASPAKPKEENKENASPAKLIEQIKIAPSPATPIEQNKVVVLPATPIEQSKVMVLPATPIEQSNVVVLPATPIEQSKVVVLPQIPIELDQVMALSARPTEERIPIPEPGPPLPTPEMGFVRLEGNMTFGGITTTEIPSNLNSERTYCICNQISYGEMIACDNKNCASGEWFHYECVNLTAAPEGKWYCQSCQSSTSSKNKKKKKKKRR